MQLGLQFSTIILGLLAFSLIGCSAKQKTVVLPGDHELYIFIHEKDKSGIYTTTDDDQKLKEVDPASHNGDFVVSPQYLFDLTNELRDCRDWWEKIPAKPASAPKLPSDNLGK